MVRSRATVPFSFRRQGIGTHWTVVVSSILKFVLVCLFEIELALSSGWPRTHSSPPALASWVLGLLWCITKISSAFCSLEVLEAWTLSTQAWGQVFWLTRDLQACWQDEMALFFFLPPCLILLGLYRATLCENSRTIHARLLVVNSRAPRLLLNSKPNPLLSKACVYYLFS